MHTKEKNLVKIEIILTARILIFKKVFVFCLLILLISFGMFKFLPELAEKINLVKTLSLFFVSIPLFIIFGTSHPKIQKHVASQKIIATQQLVDLLKFSEKKTRTHMHTFSEEIKDVSKKMNGENNTSFMFEIFFETPPYFQLEEVEELSKIIGLDQLFNHNIQEINLTKGLQYIERIYQKKIDMQEIKIKNYERFIQDLS